MRQKAYDQMTSSTDLLSVQKEGSVTFAEIPISPAGEISSSFESAAVVKGKGSTIAVFSISNLVNKCQIKSCIKKANLPL